MVDAGAYCSGKSLKKWNRAWKVRLIEEEIWRSFGRWIADSGRIVVSGTKFVS